MIMLCNNHVVSLPFKSSRIQQFRAATITSPCGCCALRCQKSDETSCCEWPLYLQEDNNSGTVRLALPKYKSTAKVMFHQHSPRILARQCHHLVDSCHQIQTTKTQGNKFTFHNKFQIKGT